MKVALKKNYSDSAAGYWKESEPFVENRYGMLIHRPISVTLFNNNRYPHIAVGHYCGATHTGKHEKFTFLLTPPAHKLVCHVCEMKAVAAGLPTSSQIAGRHVCIGRLKPINICHPENESD